MIFGVKLKICEIIERILWRKNEDFVIIVIIRNDTVDKKVWIDVKTPPSKWSNSRYFIACNIFLFINLVFEIKI